MRVGVIIFPEYRWPLAEQKWRAAEAYGFDHAWTYDHLGWRSLVDGPWFDAVPTLTAAAMVTRRIRLGTLVATPNFRHPVPFARSLLALDDVSSGRLTAGLGAGAAGVDAYDHTVRGTAPLPRKQNMDRFTEFVTQLDSLLRNERTTIKGEYFTSVEARSAPGCAQHPRAPFVIAGNGPRSQRLAAQFGQGWVTTGGGKDVRDDVAGWWRAVAGLAGRFDEVLAAADRDPAGMDRYLFIDAPGHALASAGYFRDTAGRAAELGFTDIVTHWPRADGIYAASEQVLERVATEVLPELRTPKAPKQ